MGGFRWPRNFFPEYLYDADAVEAASEAYGGLVDIDMSKEGEGIKVTISNIPENMRVC